MNGPQRILHVIRRLDGYGGARLLRSLAPRQVRSGRHVTLAALTADRAIVAEQRAAGVDVRVLQARWRVDPIAMARLARLRRRGSFDLVHAWDEHSRLAAMLTRRERPFAARMLPAAAAPIDAFATRADAWRPWGIEDDARVIVMAGPLVRGKEFHEAIWAFELVRVLHPMARLILFGDGPDRLRLERYAALVSEPGCVVFAGYQGDWTARAPHADVYWQLDRPRTTPFALVEAMAAAAPIVASDAAAHRHALIPDETALLIPRGHRAAIARATDRLLTDRALAEKLGGAARRAALLQWSLDQRLSAFDAAYARWADRSPTRD